MARNARPARSYTGEWVRGGEVCKVLGVSPDQWHRLRDSLGEKIRIRRYPGSQRRYFLPDVERVRDEHTTVAGGQERCLSTVS